MIVKFNKELYTKLQLLRHVFVGRRLARYQGYDLLRINIHSDCLTLALRCNVFYIDTLFNELFYRVNYSCVY